MLYNTRAEERCTKNMIHGEAVLGNVTRDTRAARSLMRVFVMTIKRTTTWQELGVRGGKYHISWPSVINY